MENSIISSFSLRDLAYLVAVAEEEHFGRAAKRCHVSQPTLSAQIQKIEGYLGAPMFERSNRRVAVTEAGALVVAQAKVVLEEAEKLALLSGRDKKPLCGPLRLGAIATLGPYFIPRFLGPLRKAYPKLELVLTEGMTNGLLEELRSGELDAVLASRTFKEDGFRVFSLFHEPFVLMAPKGHAIAEKKMVRAADLRPPEMILLEDGHCLTDETLQLCQTPRGRGGGKFQTTGLETLKHLVASGMGYTLIPAMAVRKQDPINALVEMREFADRGVAREIVMVCRARSTRLVEMELLAGFLRALKT